MNNDSLLVVKIDIFINADRFKKSSFCDKRSVMLLKNKILSLMSIYENNTPVKVIISALPSVNSEDTCSIDFYKMNYCRKIIDNSTLISKISSLISSVDHNIPLFLFKVIEDDNLLIVEK